MMGPEEKRIQGMICITGRTNRAIVFFYVYKLQNDQRPTEVYAASHILVDDMSQRGPENGPLR